MRGRKKAHWLCRREINRLGHSGASDAVNMTVTKQPAADDGGTHVSPWLPDSSGARRHSECCAPASPAAMTHSFQRLVPRRYP
jgi:hypothetical protein